MDQTIKKQYPVFEKEKKMFNQVSIVSLPSYSTKHRQLARQLMPSWQHVFFPLRAWRESLRENLMIPFGGPSREFRACVAEGCPNFEQQMSAFEQSSG